MTTTTPDAEILAGFLTEAAGYLPALRAGLAALRADPADPADPSLLEEAHRHAHTIAGAAPMVGLPELGEIAHRLEAGLEEFMGGRLAPGAAAFDGLDAALDAAEAQLSEARAADADESAGDEGLPPPEFPDLDDAPDFAQLAPRPEPMPEPVPADDAPTNELLEVFRLEADDHLRVLTGVLSRARARTEAVGGDEWREVRRSVHTLKGAAAMVGFAGVTALAHRMEDLLDSYHDGGRAPSPAEVERLLAATDAIEDAVSGRPTQLGMLLDGFAAPAPVVRDASEAPRAVPVTPARRELAGATVRVPLDRLADIVKLVGELVISRSTFEQRLGDFRRLLGELGPTASRLQRVSGKFETTQESGGPAGSRPTAATDSGAGGFDALEFDRYTEFHALTRELAEAAGDVQTVGGELGQLLGDFGGHLTRQARLEGDLEDKLTRLRMVPLSTAAGRLQRTVRDAARQCGKRADLELVGEATGLDKAVLEALHGPLTHLLRNAVDHGLESPEVRTALGKPAAGRLTLAARHEGSRVVLTIADDGRGIDPERVRAAAALGRGGFDPAAAAALPPAELFDLLFLPGFTTKAEVSELSGRGVGLDAVRSVVEGLKGTVEVASELGRGTTFTIRLPMTMAVLRALLVRANRQTFAIPLEAVERVLRADPESVQVVAGNSVYRADGRTYPMAPLAHLLKLRTSADEPPARPPVVLLKAGDRHLAVVVDELLGGREVVVKDLGSHVRRAPGVSGATLLGDGSVVLILNPAEFARRAPGAPPRLAPPVEAAAAPARRALTVLVVDDSPSVRRVLTNLVERNGWTAAVAKDGLEAVELLQRGDARPDVVLSDIEMPRMDGYELLGTIRSQPELRGLPVVMITSRSGDKHRQRAVDLGASAYVTKPYLDASLVELIGHLARR